MLCNLSGKGVFFRDMDFVMESSKNGERYLLRGWGYVIVSVDFKWDLFVNDFYKVLGIL